MLGVKEVQIAPVVSAKPMTVALAGIGGYGEFYLRALLDDTANERRGMRLVGTVDPYAHRSHRLHELAGRNVPIYPGMDRLFADETPDLVILASPIALHASQTVAALEAGCNVLCEKPLSATVEQAREMIAARDRAGRMVSIGYQWSFCETIQHLKRDIQSGRFGRPIRLSTLVLWPRDRRYYSRNAWVGRLRDPATGAPIFDSPVNNACAHFLHNMFYVLGDRLDRSATPARVQAELYRANDIENYDTAAIRSVTTEGVELLFFVSHATQSSTGPILEYEFEQATVRCSGDGPVIAQFRDGRMIDYGVPASSVDLAKLWSTARAVREGTPVACGIEASLSQTQVMCAAQQSPPGISSFPSELVHVVGAGDSMRRYVQGLGRTLRECFEHKQLPAERGATWAIPAKDVRVSG